MPANFTERHPAELVAGVARIRQPVHRYLGWLVFLTRKTATKIVSKQHFKMIWGRKEPSSWWSRAIMPWALASICFYSDTWTFSAISFPHFQVLCSYNPSLCIAILYGKRFRLPLVLVRITENNGYGFICIKLNSTASLYTVLGTKKKKNCSPLS